MFSMLEAIEFLNHKQVPTLELKNFVALSREHILHYLRIGYRTLGCAT
jgi:hypothetical protein